ncbi:MAG: RluA family pseudouridine synthase [Chitinispirillaceae bacterium]|nr:RluA family pseudouridine synthase [Chitinispirillaceae bacterium]
MDEFPVPQESNGLRLDVFLSRNVSGISRARIQKLIAAGAVSVNGKAVRKRHKVETGDTVRLDSTELPGTGPGIVPQDIPLSILYEDEWYIAIDKPAGIVVHPGCGNRSGTLVNALLFHRGNELSAGSAADRPGIVHRLDKDTSGVIVAAKTNAAHAALAAAFAARGVRKKYIAFCIGRPQAGEGVIDMPLGRSRNDPVKRAPAASGKSSATGFRVLDFRKGISLVEFTPRTGRTHQIRVHCAASGFPVLADALYGGGKGRLRQVAPSDRIFAASLLQCFARQALHAASITFIHPFLNREVTVQAPMPADFRNALAMLSGKT